MSPHRSDLQRAPHDWKAADHTENPAQQQVC